MPNLSIELKRKDMKLKLEGNIGTKTLKELSQIIDSNQNNQQLNSSNERENLGDSNDPYDILCRFRNVSSRLRENKEFQKLVLKLGEEYSQYHIESIKIPSILEVAVKDKKIYKEIKLNKEELKKQVKTVFQNINKSNVDFLIIHIGGLNDNEQIEIVVDSIVKEAFNLPKTIFKSKYKSYKTLIEAIFFGNDISNYYFSSFNDDDY